VSPVDYIERARRMDMALADIGFPPGSISVDHADESAIADDSVVPFRYLWRAAQVVDIDERRWVCFSCSLAYQEDRSGPDECEADRPFTEDCGVDRGQSY
jgi:hypothetical protein